MLAACAAVAVGAFALGRALGRRARPSVADVALDGQAPPGAWFEALVANSSDLICLVDERGMLSFVGPSVRRILGYDPAAVTGQPFLHLIHPDDRADVGVAFANAIGTAEQLGASEFRIAHANGTWRSFETLATNLLEDPQVRAVVTNSRDITDRVESSAQVEHRSLHDPLTGLANRRLLVDRLEQVVNRAGRTGDAVAVFYIDLDRFKTINDRYGHLAGDRLLTVAAQRLVASVRPGDTVGRLGGDEFVVVADGASAGDAVRVAERIRAALAEPVVLPTGETVLTSASIGVVLGGANSNADGLLRDADLALYRAKELGRDRYEVFEPELRLASVRRLSTELLLRQALEQGDLVLLYSPVIDVATDQPVGALGQLRLQRPTGELVGPEEFLAVAEESGLIVTIGAGMLDGVCRQAMDWQLALGDRAPRRVAVDVSVRQLAHPSFLTQVGRVLSSSGATPDRLAIEVYESNLRTAPPVAIAALEQVRALGVKVGLTGYGSESASLTSVASLPIDYVTMDAKLVQALPDDPTARAIARAVIELASSLGRTVVGTGVSSAAQLDLLRDLGCGRAQGPLFSEPVEPVVLEHLLRQRVSSAR